MKKLILASVIAASFAIAGEDGNNNSDWDFAGQAVFYYQTTDGYGNSDLLEQETSRAATGLQLSAVNKDLFAGIGAGFELSGLSAAGLQHDTIGAMVQNAGGTTGGAISQAYLTYGINNTSFKVGRQHLPKALSPLAFTEGWNVFKSSYEAALIVNSDVPDTTLVGAWVTKANRAVGDMNDFQKVWNSDGVLMFTAQNKTFENITLTGSWYNIFDVAQAHEDQQAIWGDAKYSFGKSMKLEGQIGRIYGDYTDSVGGKDTKAVGLKFSAELGQFNTSLAWSSVNKGSINAANTAGSGVKSPLYTQGVLNQNSIKIDSNSIKLAADMKLWGGKFIASYLTSDMGVNALPSVFGLGVGGQGNYNELELLYIRNMTKNVKMFFGYILQNDDRQVADKQNFFRVWARYTF